jgi:hypothetical protein
VSLIHLINRFYKRDLHNILYDIFFTCSHKKKGVEFELINFAPYDVP